MPRFLHSADWQIGRQYSQFQPDDAVPLAQARLTAVETIARLATEQSVDAVLVAGDVFDLQTVSERTIRQLFLALAGFTGPWVMIPGNHDAALSESVWTRSQRLGTLPSNLHLALSGTILDFPELGFAALTAPLTQRHTYNDLTEWFDGAPTPDGRVRAGLAHGSMQGVLAPDIDSANPIAADRAARAARLPDAGRLAWLQTDRRPHLVQRHARTRPFQGQRSRQRVVGADRCTGRRASGPSHRDRTARLADLATHGVGGQRR